MTVAYDDELSEGDDDVDPLEFDSCCPRGVLLALLDSALGEVTGVINDVWLTMWLKLLLRIIDEWLAYEATISLLELSLLEEDSSLG